MGGWILICAFSSLFFLLFVLEILEMRVEGLILWAFAVSTFLSAPLWMDLRARNPDVLHFC
jgi:hypothetical protein